MFWKLFFAITRFLEVKGKRVKDCFILSYFFNSASLLENKYKVSSLFCDF